LVLPVLRTLDQEIAERRHALGLALVFGIAQAKAAARGRRECLTLKVLRSLMGILVSDGLVNLELVDKTLGSFVITAWEKYRPVYLDMREKTPDPFLGEYFQWLAAASTARQMSWGFFDMELPPQHGYTRCRGFCRSPPPPKVGN
jgi:hypothetical protein